MIRTALLAAFAAALAAIVSFGPVRGRVRVANACAFSTPPITYEDTEDRALYMSAMELAGYDMLFTHDPFFSQPGIEVGTRTSRTSTSDVYVPPTLLKAIAWIESNATQGISTLSFGSIGASLVSFDCGHGIMQVTSGMTVPLGADGQPTDQQALVATHFAYNIGRGAAILIDKWNAAPDSRPIAGIDTNSDPHILENWYYALWSYNGFTGPGADRSNHPLDPVYGAWPRTPFSCGAPGDGFGHNRSLYPYQELVLGCAAHPPTVQGKPMWQAAPVTLPDLNNPYWRTPLDLSNFIAPFSRMDIPTPKPAHTDPTPRPSLFSRVADLGQPRLAVDRLIAMVNIRPDESATPTTITISNIGTGLVPWRASANKSWLILSVQAGVAAGIDLPCNPGAPCQRSATLTITVDPTKVLGSDSGIVHIQGLGGLGSADVAVFLHTDTALGIPGVAKN